MDISIQSCNHCNKKAPQKATMRLDDASATTRRSLILLLGIGVIIILAQPQRALGCTVALPCRRSPGDIVLDGIRTIAYSNTTIILETSQYDMPGNTSVDVLLDLTTGCMLTTTTIGSNSTMMYDLPPPTKVLDFQDGYTLSIMGNQMNLSKWGVETISVTAPTMGIRDARFFVDDGRAYIIYSPQTSEQVYNVDSAYLIVTLSDGGSIVVVSGFSDYLYYGTIVQAIYPELNLVELSPVAGLCTNRIFAHYDHNSLTIVHDDTIFILNSLVDTVSRSGELSYLLSEEESLTDTSSCPADYSLSEVQLCCRKITNSYAITVKSTIDGNIQNEVFVMTNDLAMLILQQPAPASNCVDPMILIGSPPADGSIENEEEVDDISSGGLLAALTACML